MNIQDILSESNQLDEAPVGMARQALRRVGAKAAGAVGMQRTAGSLSGKAETGAEANKLEKGFSAYLGRQMKNVKQATAADLAGYLKSSGYPAKHLGGVSGVLQPKQLDDLILKSVVSKVSGTDTAAPSRRSPPADDAPAPPRRRSPPAPADDTAAPPRRRAPRATPPADGAPPAAAAKVPKRLVTQINKLTPQQKQELLKLL